MLAESNKYLSYPGKKKDFEKNFSFIPKRNKVF